MKEWSSHISLNQSSLCRSLSPQRRLGPGVDDGTTLAESLTTSAELVVELWHQPDKAQLEERRVQNDEGGGGGSGGGSLILIRTGNVYLGKVTVPLAALLLRKTGRPRDLRAENFLVRKAMA